MKEEFNKKEFMDFLIDEKCIGFFEELIKLSSGQESSWYVDLRRLQTSFEKLDKFTDFIKDYLLSKKLNEHLLVGVPESATLPAIEVNKKLGFKWFVALRQQLKSHGILRTFPYSVSPVDISELEFNLLEDTATTGDSVITTALHLYEGGARVRGIVVVCYREDRRWGGLLPHEYIQNHLEVPFYSMTKAREVLPLAIEKFEPSKRVIENLKKEYANNFEVYKILSNYG